MQYERKRRLLGQCADGKLLGRYTRVKKWHAGYLEVDADYGQGIEEDYIDLRPILRNLLINPSRFLKSIENVEVSYA